MKIVLSLLLLTIIYSCNKTTNNIKPSMGDAKHEVNILKKVSEKDYTSSYENIFDVEDIIILETNRQSLVRHVSKILFNEKYIYILDKQAKQLLCFGDNGKFINKIVFNNSDNKLSMSSVTDFTIIGNNNLLLYNVNDGKLLYVDELLNAIEAKQLDWFFNELSFNRKTNNLLLDIAYYENKPSINHQLILTDTNFLVKSRFYYVDQQFSFFMNSADCNGKLQYSSQTDIVSYMPYFDNYLYEIHNNELIPIVKYDFGDKLLDLDKMVDGGRDYEKLSDINEKGFFHSIAYANATNYTLLSFSYLNEIYHHIFNKLTEKSLLVKTPSDPTCGCGSTINFKGFYSDNLIMTMKPENLSFVLNQTGINVTDSEILDRVNGLTSVDNPLIFLLKPKR